MVDSLYTGLEKELLRLNEGRIVTIRTLVEVRDERFREENALNTILGFISLLLVAVTSMGIVGLTAFSVTQRTRQIGTRRALGATRWAILRYFLVENWVVTSLGLGTGLFVTYGLNYVLAGIVDVPIIGLPLVGGGVAVLWAAGLLAALIPAIRGTMVQPVIATRTV